MGRALGDSRTGRLSARSPCRRVPTRTRSGRPTTKGILTVSVPVSEERQPAEKHVAVEPDRLRPIEAAPESSISGAAALPEPRSSNEQRHVGPRPQRLGGGHFDR